jgi:hypothetical protein
MPGSMRERLNTVAAQPTASPGKAPRTVSGIFTTVSARATSTSAKPFSKSATTRSPIATSFTSSPADSTTPQASWPPAPGCSG